jgi:hypothetical protein
MPFLFPSWKGKHSRWIEGEGAMPLVSSGYDPSPEEIASACAAINRQWSISERNRRLAGPLSLSKGLCLHLERPPRNRPRVELTPDLAAELEVRRDL